MSESLPDVIAILPGSRAVLKITTAEGKELVMLDVHNSLYEYQDDGGVALDKNEQPVMNKEPWFVACGFFPGRAFLRRSHFVPIPDLVSWMDRLRVLENEVKALEGERERLNHELQHGGGR